MDKLKLFNVTDEYINYLRKYDGKVFSNKEEDRKKERKYLGVLLQINGFNYFVPLSCPKNTDYVIENGEKVIRNSVVPIIRIVSKDVDGNDELKGTLKFSNMIPIPGIALIDYDIQKEADEDYKILILKELDFIHTNKGRIFKNASIIYNQKINNYKKINYLKDTVDFKLLEQKCREYEYAKKIENQSLKEALATKTD